MPIAPTIGAKHAGHPDDPVERWNQHLSTPVTSAGLRPPPPLPKSRSVAILYSLSVHLVVHNFANPLGDSGNAKPEPPPATPAVPHPRRRPRPRSPLAPRRRSHPTPHNSRPCPHPPMPPTSSPARHPPTLAPRPERAQSRRAAIPLSGAQMHPAAPQEFFWKKLLTAHARPQFTAPATPTLAPQSASDADPGTLGEGLGHMNLVGYTDRLSAAPGDTVRFMVSSEHPRFRADLVRLIHGDESPAGPGYREREVPSAMNGDYPGRSKPIHSGSYVYVPGHPALDAHVQLHRHRLDLPYNPDRRPPGPRISLDRRPRPLKASPWSSGPTATSASIWPTAKTRPSKPPPARRSTGESGPS